MRVRSLLVLAVLIGSVLVGPAVDAGEEKEVLSKQDYWRCFYTFGFGMSESGRHYTQVRIGGGGIKAVSPPADWFRADFDDSSWVPLRGGLDTDSSHIVRQAYFRGCFDVADPAAAKGLRLLVAVRGGAVAYVNGQEVGRAALPAGPVKADTWAKSYPMEAYGRKREDGKVMWFADYEYGAPYTNGAGFTRYGGSGGKWPLSNRNLSWKHYVQKLSKPEWKQLNDLRNRKIDVEVPTKLLRKGRNVVAFAVVTSKTKVMPGFKKTEFVRWDIIWPHGTLLGVKLTSKAPGVVGAPRGAKGVQVWSVDLHQRLFNYDYSPYGVPPARIEMVGARNGVFSGQIAVRSGATLTGLSATATELTGPGGAKIPASAIQVRYGLASSARTISSGAQYGVSAVQHKCLADYSRELASVPNKSRLEKLKFFDRLTAKPPASVPAGSCQPVWVTVRVPKSARAGEYKGKLTVKTGAGKDMVVPVTLKVSGWTVPDPQKFVSVVGVEQSPWGVLAAYPKTKPWSDEHFKLMERSFKMLAELGSEVVVVPVQAPSEFGNRVDSLVPWVKKAGGGYDYDFKRADRYLDLAIKHMGKPTVVEFVVVDPYPRNPRQHGAVVVDKAGGKQTRVNITPQTAEGGKVWAACAKAIHAYMKKKGLVDRMYWGRFHDFPIPKEQKTFTEAVPGVGWARCSHQGRPNRALVKYAMTILVLRSVPRNKKTGHWSLMGWKNPDLHVVFPRIENKVLTVDQYSDPYCFRMLPEKAVAHGARGVGRMGFDYWGNYGGGWHRGGSNTTLNMFDLSWPGPGGAEGTARLEVFREGLQEAEARIAIEKRLDNGLGKTPGGAKVWAMLDARIRETGFIPSYWPSSMSQYYSGWQERSRKLFETAAEVAGGHK